MIPELVIGSLVIGMIIAVVIVVLDQNDRRH